MNKSIGELSERYTASLRNYLTTASEAGLQDAYDLGRHAVANGLGVLDVAKIHQQASVAVLLPASGQTGNTRHARALEDFFMEALSPFEAHHRGFREANARLKDLNEILERRAAELAATNRELSHEITRRKASEEMWKRYESIVNTSREFLTLVASNYCYEAVNDAYCHGHKKLREEILGSTVADVWGKTTFNTVIKKYLDQCFGGDEVHYQAWFSMAALGRRYFDVSYYPYSEKGGVTHAIVVTRDISDRWEAEQAVRESEEQFRTLMQSATDAIIVANSKGSITACNRAAQTMFDRTSEDVLGQPISLLIPERHQAGYVSGIRGARHLSAPGLIGKTVELRGQKKDGTEFPLELSLAAWETARGRFFCGIIRDITERKRAEEALRKSEEHYRDLFNEASAMQEKLRELSSKILHTQEEERKRISRELHDAVGQALTAISVNLQLLKKKASRVGGDLDAIVTETQRMLEQTMNDVHRFSYELRPVMLDDLGLIIALRWHIKAFTRRTGIKVSLCGDSAVEKLSNEPKLVIYRIVQESLTNVYKYAGAKKVTIGIRKTATGINLRVKDDGRGFRVDCVSAASKDKGGLGLIGMQERLRLVNGRFDVESAPGKGTLIQAAIPFQAGKLQSTRKT